ncbi:hypothetical protein G6R29_02080 [Fructobacillus sp. M2-14]|uniref:Uncharacterized protein n=1 Tax=Fructobacillus broussonetiae TaxID=2713173 RepID=A0ABS5QYZ8_9LACO|nr:hypothetical protein [Fructobacillus broussonetiae]MBS9338425.1 hypothetical protein [Fructobacillus broussonetiae]
MVKHIRKIFKERRASFSNEGQVFFEYALIAIDVFLHLFEFVQGQLDRYKDKKKKNRD